MNQLVESLRRLYRNNMIGKSKIIKLFESGKITDVERDYILSN